MKLLSITTGMLLFSTLLFGQADMEFFKKLGSMEGKAF